MIAFHQKNKNRLLQLILFMSFCLALSISRAETLDSETVLANAKAECDTPIPWPSKIRRLDNKEIIEAKYKIKLFKDYSHEDIDPAFGYRLTREELEARSQCYSQYSFKYAPGKMEKIPEDGYIVYRQNYTPEEENLRNRLTFAQSFYNNLPISEEKAPPRSREQICADLEGNQTRWEWCMGIRTGTGVPGNCKDQYCDKRYGYGPNDVRPTR